MKQRQARHARLMVAAAAVVCALAIPAAAQAASVGVSGDTLVIVGGSEDNHVQINGGGDDNYYVTDTAGLNPGSGCTAVDSSGGTTCGTAGTTKISASLGAGDDVMEDDGYYLWHHTTNSFVVDGGSGEDTIDLRTSDGLFAPTHHGILGGPGNDLIYVDSAGGAKNNAIDAGIGNDAVHDQSSSGTGDQVELNAGNDSFFGGDDNSTIDGGAGDDHLNGGGGDDDLTGGPGRDTIVGDSSDLSITGNDTIHVVDGQADSVSCGLGGDVVDADQFDTVDTSECEDVHRTHVGFTSKPRPKALAKHPKKPRFGHTYKGKTSAGRKITLKVKKKGRRLTFKIARVDVGCASPEDGFDLTDNTQGGHPKLKKKKLTFSNTSRFNFPSDGISGGVFYVVGGFSGRKARGTIVVNARSGGENCSSGPIKWHASV